MPRPRCNKEGYFRRRVLPDLDDPVRLHPFLTRRRPVRPGHLDRVRDLRARESEVLAHVVLRQITRAALHQTPLCRRSGPHRDDRADGVRVGRLPMELDDQPMAAPGELVVENLRPAVQIVDDDVEAAVVVDVSGGEAAAHAFLHERLAESGGDLLEGAVAAIAIEQLALAIPGRRAHPHAVQLRIDMPVDRDEIQPGVVVVVKERVAPSDVGQADGGGARSKRHIGEVVPVVAVQRVVLLREIGDEQAEASAVVVIADRDAHAALFGAVLADGDARRGTRPP